MRAFKWVSILCASTLIAACSSNTNSDSKSPPTSTTNPGEGSPQKETTPESKTDTNPTPTPIKPPSNNSSPDSSQSNGTSQTPPPAKPETPRSSFDPNAEFANLCDRQELGQMLAQKVYAEDCSKVPVKDLQKIQYLTIYGLKMKALPPNGLEGLTALSSLQISNCPELEEISAEAFRGLPNLRSFSMSQTSVSKIGRGTFSEVPNIDFLSIYSNTTKTIETGAFDGLTKLRKLNVSLSLTDLTVQPDAFRGLVNLQELDLSFNRKIQIADGSFRGLERLTSLDLANNDLKTISGGVLEGLTQLAYLNLKGNELKQVPSEVLRFCSPQFVLDLGQNWIRTLPKGVLQNTEFKTLILLNSYTESVEPGAFAGAKIGTLFMAENKLQYLSQGTFAGLTAETVDLSENQISGLAEGAFTGLAAKEINLRSNVLLTINRARAGVAPETRVSGLDNETAGLTSSGSYTTPIRKQPGTPSKPGSTKPSNSTQSNYLAAYNQTHTCDLSQIKPGTYDTKDLRCLNSTGVPSDRALISLSSSQLKRKFFRGDKIFNDTSSVEYLEPKNKAGLCLVRLTASSFACNDDQASCMTLAYIGKNKRTGKTEMIFPSESFSFCRGADESKVEQVIGLD